LARSTVSASLAFVPPHADLVELRAAVQCCRACPLYRHATQAVFGEGPESADVFFVGEQPGDAEDMAGRPFVGPAGRELAQALDEVGIDRGAVFVTNAVKHFKFVRRGKKRIHDKPNQTEIQACRGWLDAELHAVHPLVIVCLGATAAQTFLGTSFRLTKHRGEILTSTPHAPYWMATYHPSAILRMPEEEARHEARRLFTADLAQIATLLPQVREGHCEAGPSLSL
jgi:DNA polymerase